MTLSGTLEFVDIGTGVWVLNVGDGKRFTLLDNYSKALDGKTVTVTGEIIKGVGIAMMEDTFKVESMIV